MGLYFLGTTWLGVLSVTKVSDTWLSVSAVVKVKPTRPDG